MTSREEENTIFYSFGSVPRSHSTKKSSQSKLNPSQFTVLLFLLRRYADETAVPHQEGRALFCGLYIKYLCQNSYHPGLINHNMLQCNDKLEKRLI